MIVRLALLASLFHMTAWPVAAQQAVRVPVDSVQLTAQLYRPSVSGKVPAVAIFHGCGGVGVNNTRMAELLKGWGYAALVVDSFTARHMTDVCGRHWPSEADAMARVADIDASLSWLASQDFVDAGRLAYMGYSYGGGVALLRAFSEHKPAVRAVVLVYPDCGLSAPLGPAPEPRQPTLFAMGELDDWTPVAECQALIGRVKEGRTLIEAHVYAGAHHSFDALGLPVRYLAGVGNRSKPGGCCGAHYGGSEAAWNEFVADAKAFFSESFAR